MREDRVLVQGAAGFVGRSLLPLLPLSGFNDLILVDARAVPDILLHKLSLKGAHVTTAQADTLERFLDEDITAVISLAGQTNVDEALDNPKDAFAGNTKIAFDLGEFLLRNKRGAKLVYVSSDEVLGPSFYPLHEDAPHRPTQPYAASKAAAEIILHNYRDVYGLNVATLRSCNLIGSQQRARKLIPVAVKSLCASYPVPVFGDGYHLREWMAVEDICAAIIRIVCEPTAVGVYQASSNIQISVRDVVSLIAHALDLEPHVRLVADRLINDRSYSMETSRLRALGWEPKCLSEKMLNRLSLL